MVSQSNQPTVQNPTSESAACRSASASEDGSHAASLRLPAELRALYPFASHFFTTPSGARMHYLDEAGQGIKRREGSGETFAQAAAGKRPRGAAIAGPAASTTAAAHAPRAADSAEAVLMLHGNPTWSFYYAQLVQTVSPALRCIVPDHIGMGLSEKPEDYSYRLETRIDDVAALVAHLGLTRVHLVVHDWGGAIGFGFAARHPELIGRIVVLNTAAFPSPRIPARIALCKAPVLGPLIVRGLNGFARPALSMSMARRKLSALEKRALLFPYDSWASRVAINAFVRDIPMRKSHPSWPVLNAVEQGISRFQNHPALILWGGRDFCFNTAFYDEWRRRLPQAKAHFLADTGHYVLLDAANEVVPQITRFLVG